LRARWLKATCTWQPARGSGRCRHHTPALSFFESDCAVSQAISPGTRWRGVAGFNFIRCGRLLRFGQYDEVIQAAIEGQGLALGRSSLIQQLLMRRRLVAPFAQQLIASQAYFVLAAPAEYRPEVKCFVDWVQASARAAG